MNDIQTSMVQLLDNNQAGKYNHVMYPSNQTTAHTTHREPRSPEDRQKQWDTAVGILQGLGVGTYRGVVQALANIPRAGSYLVQFSPTTLPLNAFQGYRNAFSQFRTGLDNAEDKARNLLPLSNKLTPQQNLMFDQVIPTMVDFASSALIPTGAASKAVAGAKYAIPVAGKTQRWLKAPIVNGVYGYFKSVPARQAEWAKSFIPRAVGTQGDAISWGAPLLEVAAQEAIE